MGFIAAGLVAALALPWLVAVILRRADAAAVEAGGCYGLDGRTSLVCCDEAGFAGAACDCPCHRREARKVSACGPARVHHHLHRGAAPLHPVAMPPS